MAKALNIEIKARCEDIDKLRVILKQHNARFVGVDHQIDTYFFTQNGRLKLREGNIENHLIFYERNEVKGLKKSDVLLYRPQETDVLKDVLSRALGVRVVVDKQREIYFIDNVKFHLDIVKGLGNFVEIEAIDSNGTLEKEFLTAQCEKYLNVLGIPSENLISGSYSDMLLDKNLQKGK